MIQSIFQISLLVNDYDEAINFYVEKLGFVLLEDIKLSNTKRWVVIAANENSGCNLLLAKAANEQQQKFVGNQNGGRVFLFMYTDDIDEYYQLIIKNKVNIIREPSEEVFGKVFVFADLYGNLWDVIQPINAI